MNKKKLIIPIVAGIATVGIITGVTYAYFSARVTEENKTETIIKTNTLGLTYTGELEINASNMIPGDSFTKTFKVENTSNIAVTYNIYMDNVLNEFDEDLVYTLTDETGKVIEETKLPETKNGKTYLMTKVNINAGATKSYTLKIEFKYDANKNQNAMQGKTFSTTVGIDTEQVEIAFTGLCKRAKTLHTEECTQTDNSNSCSADGFTSDNKGVTISYGSLGTKGTLNSGDAFDCDVNGDGEYNSENERFYYVSDYYNTTTKEFESDTATLIYYNNTTDGIADNTSASLVAYYDGASNVFAPKSLLKNIPTTQWSNVTLKNARRQILSDTGTTSTMAGVLNSFSYGTRSARLITTQEIINGCNISSDTRTTGELSNCNYLLENTKYSNRDLGTYGFWTGTPIASSDIDVAVINSSSKSIINNHIRDNTKYGYRPTIDVAKTEMEI